MNLLLEGEDGSHATIDWIRQTSLSLVADGEHRIATSWQRNVEQEFCHIAGTEYFMHSCKSSCTLLGPEVRGEDATPHALPSQEFARPAWCSTAHGGSVPAGSFPLPRWCPHPRRPRVRRPSSRGLQCPQSDCFPLRRQQRGVATGVPRGSLCGYTARIGLLASLRCAPRATPALPRMLPNIPTILPSPPPLLLRFS